MLHAVTTTNVTAKDYEMSHVFSGSSSREEFDTTEILDLFSSCLKREGQPNNLLLYKEATPPLFEIDLSSVNPYFEPITITSIIEEAYKTIILDEMIEHDVMVRIPPRRRYIIELEVTELKRAKPNIVEPEGI